MKKLLIILIIPFLVGCQSSSKTESENIEKKSINDVISIDSIATLKQNFIIQNEKDSLIELKGGIKVFIPANSFIDDSNKSYSNVSLGFKECNNKSDMILENLSTSSDSNLLITNGMIEISAFSEDENTRLKLQDKSELQIYFPKNNNSEDYYLFYGEKSENNINWIKDNRKPIQEEVKKRNSIQKQYKYGYKISGFTIRIGDDFIPTYKFLDKTIKDDFFEFLNANFKPSQEALKELYKLYNLSSNTSFDSSTLRVKINFDKEINISNIEFFGSNALITIELSNFLRNLTPKINYTTVNNHDINLNKPNLKFSIYGIKELAKDDFIEKFEKQNIAESTNENLNYYVYSVSNLGWINCDKFYKYEDVITQNISLKDNDLEYSLIFKDINSILKGFKNQGVLYFNKIPPNERVTLVGYKILNDSILFCQESFTSSERNYKVSNSTVISLNEFKKELLSLNKKSP